MINYSLFINLFLGILSVRVSAMKRIYYICLLFFLLVPQLSWADNYKAALFIPRSDAFWTAFASYTKASSDDIGLELEIHNARESRETMLSQVEAVSRNGADAIIFMNYQDIGESILEVAEKYEIPAFLVNTKFKNGSLKPRNQYRYWIGELAADDEHAGYLLARRLSEIAEKRGITSLNIFAFEGVKKDVASLLRIDGLRSFVTNRENSKIIGTVAANGDREQAKSIFKRALLEHPNINMVWGANDRMAQGAAEAAREMGIKHPIVFGGINWDVNALKALEQGNIDINIGGHVFDGAFAAIMVLDYLNGHDFSNERLSFRSNMVSITRENYEIFKNLFVQPESIDFKSYSKAHNQKLLQYNFSLTSIAEKAFAVPPVTLAPDEQAWLAAHPEITLGFTAEIEPLLILGEDGQLSGILKDIYDELESTTGLKVNIEIDEWSSTIRKARDGKIDGLLVSASSLAEDVGLIHTHILTTGNPTVFAKKDAPFEISSEKNLKGKKISVLKGIYVVEQALEPYKDAIEIVETESALEMMKMVLEGKVDAAYGLSYHNYLINKYFLIGIEPVYFSHKIDASAVASIRADWSEFVSIMNKVLEAIGKDELNAINQKWTQLETKQTVDLTPEEKDWIKAHPKIILGTDKEWRPYVIVEEDGSVSGIEGDFIEFINDLTGTNIRIVTGKWSNMVKKAKTREIDGLAVSTYHREREADFLFTESPYRVSKYIFTRSDEIKAMEDLVGRRVGLLRGNRLEEKLLKGVPGIIPVPADSNDTLISLLQNGQIDAVIGGINLRLVAVEKMIPDIGIAFIVPDSETKMLYSIRNDWPELHSIINKALAAIPLGERLTILEKWVGISTEKETLPLFRGQLTADEKQWINQNPELARLAFRIRSRVVLSDAEFEWLATKPSVPVRVGNYPPFFFAEDGKPQGLSIDYVKVMSIAFGLDCNYVLGMPITESFSSMKKPGGIAIQPAWQRTAAREKLATFTNPYLFSPFVIFQRNDGEGIRGIEDLVGKRVVVEKNYAIHKLLESEYPELQLVEVNFSSEALKLLSSGGADAYVSSLLAGNYLSIMNGLSNIVVVAQAPFDPNALSIAVRKDWPELASIINKGMNAIEPFEHAAVKERWTVGFDESVLAAKKQIPLTSEEKAWLKSRPAIKVRVGNFPPFHFLDHGKPSGFSVELINRISAQAGFEVQYVSGLTWLECLEHVRNRDGEVDLLLTAMNTAERREFMSFSRDYLELPFKIFTRRDNNTVKDINDLIGKTVAIERGYSLVEKIRRAYPGINLMEVDGYAPAALRVVSLGNTDAYIGNLPTANYHITSLGLTNMKAVANTPFGFHTQAMGVRKDWPEFVSILNKALAAIPQDEYLAMLEKWGGAAISSIRDQLSEDEKLWLDAHLSVSMCVDPNWMPFEQINEAGEFEGMVADYMELFSNNLGISFEFYPTKTYEESLSALSSGECILLSSGLTDEAVRKGLVTKGYLSITHVFAVHQDVPFIHDINEFANRRIGTVLNYPPQYKLEKLFPETELVLVENVDIGIRMVASGELDAFVESMTAISYSIQNQRLSNVKIGSIIPGEIPLTMMANKNGSSLIPILNKAIDSITRENRKEIADRWIPVHFERGVDYTLLLQIMSAVTIVLALFLYWNRRLSREVKARQRTEVDLQKAKEVAEAANQSKSLFLANMSHEIRTPMNAVLGFTEILKSEESDKKKIHYIESIHSGGKALLSLINDILDLSKVEAGKLDLQYSAVSIDKLLREIRVIFEQKISEQGLEFIIEKVGDIPRALLLDETRIRQILINLLSNAVKFTTSGFIKLNVSATETESTISSRVNLSITVEDSGIGIPEDQCKKVFDAFEQVKGQKTKEYGGTGLGLAITRRLVEMMDGEIHCKSIVGKGTAFHIDLNNLEVVATDALTEKENILDEKDIWFDPASILIVDDIDYNRELIAFLLKDWEFTIIEAENGVEGLAQAGKHKLDLILLDMKMPEMDGYEMSEQLHNNEDLKDIPVIAVTASALKQDEEVILKLCDGYLRKPISRTDLVRELMKHLPYTVAEASKEEQQAPILPSKLIFPSHEHLKRIIDASLAGNITDLGKCIAEIRDMDSKYQPFIDKIEFWVKKFQFGEIIGFLQKQTGKT